MSLEIEDFLEMQVAECGASPNTVAAYRRDLNGLEDFLKKDNIDLLRATNQNLRDYLGYLTTQQYALKTQSRHLSSIREFYRFLYSENKISKNPTDYLQAPKTQKSLPKYLSEEDIALLIQGAQKDVRLQTLLEVLYASGMRVSELVSLPVEAVAREKKHIFITGKGNKERLVPLNDQACEKIQKWCTVREILDPRNAKSKWLFPAKSKSGHLTRGVFFKELKDDFS